jgi:DNA end-binding protein Ku
MRGKDMVALGRVVLSKRERVIMLQPWEKGLLGTTLRYSYEVREAKDYFYDIAEVKVEPDLLALAEHILKTKEAKFDPTKFVDRYEQAVVEMLDKKKVGLPTETVKAVAPTRNVVNLFEAFRQSLAESERELKADKEAKAPKAPPAEKATKAKKAKPRVPGQGEMLLPIPGKKAEEKKAEDKKVVPISTARKAG